MGPKVYIIILNYVNWEDTIECLNSLESLSYDNYETIVIDNCSPNKSFQELQKYISSKPSYSVHLILSPDNGGFAKGNNLGLSYAQNRADGNYYWLLNNDTVVQKDSLLTLVGQAEKEKANKTGLFGSKLRYYHHPDILQAVGAKYNKWFGIVKETGNLEIDNFQYDNLQSADFLPGASFLISHACLKEIGIMDENLFLYFEELDWAERARRTGWKIRLVPKSIVFHKHGASIKSSGLQKNEKSLLSDFYFWRNKLIITRKYYPYCLLTVYLSYIFTIVNRLIRGQGNRIGILLNILVRYKTIKWK